MTEFNLSEKRKEYLKGTLKILDKNDQRYLKRLVREIFFSIEQQDKEFIKLLKKEGSADLHCGCGEKDRLFFITESKLNKLAGSKLSNSIGDKQN